MIVIFDSNIWLSDLGLRSGAASAVRFFLHQEKAKVGVPEIIKLEVSHNFTKNLKEKINDIRRNHHQLLTIFGKLKEMSLPSDEEIKKKVDELFESIGVAQFLIPFDLQSAQSAMDKAIKKLPPCDKTQEFKDAVIWANCISLLSQDDVIFVTSDKAFYKDREYKNGLATNLYDEITGNANKLKLYSSINDLLNDIKTSVVVNEDELCSILLGEAADGVNRLLSTKGFGLADNKSFAYKIFATESPSNLFLKFSLQIACNDLMNEGRIDAFIQMEGDAMYSPDTGKISNLEVSHESLSFIDSDGTQRNPTNHYLRALSGVFGHKDVIHETRYEL